MFTLVRADWKTTTWPEQSKTTATVTIKKVRFYQKQKMYFALKKGSIGMRFSNQTNSTDSLAFIKKYDAD